MAGEGWRSGPREESELQCNAHCAGAPTSPPERVEMRKMTLQFHVRNAEIFSSDQLKTYDIFSLSYIRVDSGGARGYLGSSINIRKEPHASL